MKPTKISLISLKIASKSSANAPKPSPNPNFTKPDTEKGTEKIAIEIKSFTRPSDMKDLEEAVGQFVVYAHLLKRYYPEHKLFLAVSENTCKTVFEEEAGQTLIQDGIIQLFSFDPNQEVILRWLP